MEMASSLFKTMRAMRFRRIALIVFLCATPLHSTLILAGSFATSNGGVFTTTPRAARLALRQVTYSGGTVNLPSTRGPSAPVAPRMFPGVRSTKSFASRANATASFASPSR